MDVSTSVYLRSHSALNNFQSAEKKDITDWKDFLWNTHRKFISKIIYWNHFHCPRNSLMSSASISKELAWLLSTKHFLKFYLMDWRNSQAGSGYKS
jgi:hypothetical protein